MAMPTGRVGTRPFLLMREIVRMGHHGLIFTSDSNHLVPVPELAGPSSTRVIDGVQMTWIRTFKYKGANSLGRIISWFDFEWRLRRLPKRPFRRPDVVIVSSLSLLTIFNGLLLRRRFGCRLVFEVRDIWPLVLTEEGGFSRRNPFVMALAWVERFAYRSADAVVGTMPNLKQHVVEVTGGGPSVHCIPQGVDETLAESREPLPIEYENAHIPQGKFLIGYAGTIGVSNALETLFICARAMRDKSNVHFLVIGEGDLKPHYKKMCADLPNVSFAPVVPKSMLQEVLRRCDLLYFSVRRSRRWKFGQSLNKLVDYMLAGRPIVGSYSGYPSMIDESGGGSYVPAEDPEALQAEIMRYMQMSAEDRNALGAAARSWLLENRRYSRLAHKYLRLALPERASL
jgi:glycosyltransferase involved in cell wall biosynthesis